MDGSCYDASNSGMDFEEKTKSDETMRKRLSPNNTTTTTTTTNNNNSNNNKNNLPSEEKKIFH